MYLSDIHTHSIASGHGTTCTISDMAKSASQKGLKLLGITDHGPATLAAGTSSYFRSLTYSPRKRFDVELLYGIELNILDTDGKTDRHRSFLISWTIQLPACTPRISILRPGKKIPKAFLNVMKNPVIKILGHIDNTQYDIDYDAVVKAAGENGVLLEMNASFSCVLRISGRYPQPTARRSCPAAGNIWFQSYFPVTVMEQSILETSFYAADFVHNAMFPEGLILNNQIPKLKMLLSIR